MMKRIAFFFTLILCCIIIYSCDNTGVTNDTDATFWKTSASGYDHGVIKKEYNGHTYIFFKEYERMGVVHDPDCKCHANDTIYD